MANLKKYDLKGKELEEVSLEKELLEITVNSQLVKDYLVAVRKNARQWSANTKGRSELAQSNAKPHPQKGTGKARQGSLKSPQYRGGATVFGPKPKFNQHVRINRKERRAAISYLLAQKALKGNIRFLKLGALKAPKTKSICSFLKAAGIENKRILFLCDGATKTEKERKNFYLSMRNIPRTYFLPITNFSGYDVIANQELVVLDSAKDEFMKALGKR
ncbi:MAG: 50S ribosomal protein L4 [Chlamydiae bacterium]|nr:50S ribosomal protein L4 [Chlamydiota bacterium]